MKKINIKKISLIVILSVLVVVGAGIAYIVYFRPAVPLQEIKVNITPERVERGKYLANHVTVCIDCHSTRDWSRFSGPVVAGTEGRGGEKFDLSMGFPGTFYSPNITPFNLAGWTDGEIYRAITSGVGKDGRPFFPVMPYPYYAKMATEDIYSIIAYIRTLPSISYTAPASKADFPMNIILHLIPGPAAPQVKPPASDTVAYGKYLVNASGCIECHTPVEKGQIIPEKAYTGGREFQLPSGLVRSVNITPDPETGIGTWTESSFIARFKAYDLSVYTPAEVKNGEMTSVMPWTMYAGMDSTDLKAIHAYLKTLTPVKNAVVRFTPMK